MVQGAGVVVPALLTSPFAVTFEPGAVLGGVTVAGVAAGPTGLPYGVAGSSSDDRSFL